MNRQVSRSNLHHQIDLQTPLRNLDLSHHKTQIESLISQVKGELSGKGLLIQPHFYISTDWFVADGSTSVAIPFYCFDVALRRLERLNTGAAEGCGRYFLKYLRHEIGHVIDNAYNLRADRERCEVFGASTTPYRAYYEPQRFSRKFVSHLPSQYAQSHPDEDFAETFAVWLDPGSNWKKRYRGTPAAKKLMYIDRLMRRLRGRKPVLDAATEVDPIMSSTMTLARYYGLKKRYLKLAQFAGVDAKLERVFYNRSNNRSRGRVSRDLATQSVPAASVLRQNRREFCREVASETGLYQYKVEKVITEMIKRCQTLGIRTRAHDPERAAKLKRLIVSESRRFLQNGLYREAR